MSLDDYRGCFTELEIQCGIPGLIFGRGNGEVDELYEDECRIEISKCISNLDSVEKIKKKF